MRSFRFLVSAAMLLVAAGGVVASACSPVGSPRGVRSIAASQLAWDALTLDGRQIADSSRPTVFLYIAPSCVHCEAAALAFVKAIAHTGVHGLIVSAEDHEATNAYQARLELPPVALDRDRRFGKAAGIRWVPTLVTLASDGSAKVQLLPSAELVARYVREAQQ